jgi:hypothetical protein
MDTPSSTNIALSSVAASDEAATIIPLMIFGANAIGKLRNLRVLNACSIRLEAHL